MNTFLRKLVPAVVAALLLPYTVRATLEISLDADARATVSSTDESTLGLQTAGLLLRKTIADPDGDRFILTLLAEAYDTFREQMIHEASLRLKGPMSRWNVTAGRFSLPYGLIPSFSTTRLLLSSWYDEHFGFDADNGMLLSGITGDIDYGIAVTQGLGPHHRFSLQNQALVSGRIGYTFGEAGEYLLGVSGIHGKTAGMHGTEMPHDISGAGIDATVNSGPLTLRTSLDGGLQNKDTYLLGYLFTQYSLNRFVDIDIGGRYGKIGNSEPSGSVYAGGTTRNRFITIRGGYTYEKTTTEKHQVTLQLYRAFSAVM